MRYSYCFKEKLKWGWEWSNGELEAGTALTPMGVVRAEANFVAWQRAHACGPLKSSRAVTAWVGQNPGSARWSSVESWATSAETCRTRPRKAVVEESRLKWTQLTA